MDFTDIFRAFHPKATEYTLFLSAHGTFSRIDHILGHKSGLTWYQKIGIELEGVMLSEISQSEKDMYHMTSLI